MKQVKSSRWRSAILPKRLLILRRLEHCPLMLALLMATPKIACTAVSWDQESGRKSKNRSSWVSQSPFALLNRWFHDIDDISMTERGKEAGVRNSLTPTTFLFNKFWVHVEGWEYNESNSASEHSSVVCRSTRACQKSEWWALFAVLAFQANTHSFISNFEYLRSWKSAKKRKNWYPQTCPNSLMFGTLDPWFLANGNIFWKFEMDAPSCSPPSCCL